MFYYQDLAYIALLAHTYSSLDAVAHTLSF